MLSGVSQNYRVSLPYFGMCQILWAIAFCFSIVVASTAGEIDIQADSITFDQTAGVYIAKGQVLIVRDKRQLLADNVEYNQQTGWIKADGQVQLKMPNGDTLFADSMEIDDSLQQEKISQFRARTGNNVRIAASNVIKQNDSRIFDHFVYSPCHTCQKNPDRPPIWQLKAQTAEHDLKNRDYVLRDAVIEFAGWPIAYAPYLRYPDASVQRRTGFLTPDVGTSSHLGGYVSAPFFFDLGLDKNLTLTPIMTSKAGATMLLDYEQRTDNGSIDLQTSAGYFALANQSSQQAVGHIDGNAHFAADEGISYGGNIRVISNLGYASILPNKHFAFSAANSSRAFIQQIPDDQPRRLFRAEMVNYQDERDIAGLPIAPSFVPTVQGSVYFPTDRWGGRLKLHGMARHIQQSDIAQSQSVSLSGQWQNKHFMPNGVVAEYQLQLDSDYFHYSTTPGSGLDSGSRFRILSKLSVQYGLPLQNQFANGSLGILQPLVKISGSPASVHYDSIPNQDTSGLFDPESLLFANENTTGLTTRDDGTKMTLALKYDHTWLYGNRASVLVGKSFALRPMSSDDSMLRNRPKDYLLRFSSDWQGLASFENTVNFDHDTARINSNHLLVNFDPLWYNLAPQLGYLYQRADAELGISRLHQGSVGLQHSLGQYWNVRGQLEFDFEQNSALRKGLIAVDYDDESLNLSLYARHRQVTSAFVESDNSVGLSINLKFGGQSRENN